VHRHDDPERRIDVLELLAHNAEADVVHAGAAELLRHRTAEQAELRHLRKNVPVEAVLPVELVDLWRDGPRSPLPHRLLEEPLLLRQVQINHESPLLKR
jgi:hypothetical protein